MPLKWTEEEDRALRIMAEKGISIQDMPKVLKSRSVDAISKRMKRLGLSFQEQMPVIDWNALEELTL